MAVEFNKFGNYNKYNFKIGQDTTKKAQQANEEIKEAEKQVNNFKGLENETDLLTQGTQSFYGIKITKFSNKDKNIADETNQILAGLGFNYKVTPNQVASVANGLQNVILPAMQLAENGATAARIEDPKGPFADLFAKDI